MLNSIRGAVALNNYIDQFFERIYNAEIEQKHRLDSADTFLVGIIGALIGVGAYLLQTIAKCNFGCAFCFLVLFGIPFFVSLTVALGFVIASIWPRFKDYIASPQQWADYAAEFERYFAYYKIQEPELSERVALEVSKLCRQQYISAAETNRKLIVTKHAYQTKAKRFIVVAVVCMFLSAFPLFFIHASEIESAVTTNSGCCQCDPGIEIDNNEQPTRPTDAADTTNKADAADTTNSTDAVDTTNKASPSNGQPFSGGRIENQETTIKEESEVPDAPKDTGSQEKPASPSAAGPPARPTAPGIIKVEASYPVGDKLPSRPNLPIPPITPPEQ